MNTEGFIQVDLRIRFSIRHLSFFICHQERGQARLPDLELIQIDSQDSDDCLSRCESQRKSHNLSGREGGLAPALH
jgi:hypothetical protein